MFHTEGIAPGQAIAGAVTAAPGNLRGVVGRALPPCNAWRTFSARSLAASGSFRSTRSIHTLPPSRPLRPSGGTAATRTGITVPPCPLGSRRNAAAHSGAVKRAAMKFGESTTRVARHCSAARFISRMKSEPGRKSHASSLTVKPALISVSEIHSAQLRSLLAWDTKMSVWVSADACDGGSGTCARAVARRSCSASASAVSPAPRDLLSLVNRAADNALPARPPPRLQCPRCSPSSSSPSRSPPPPTRRA